MYIYIYIYIITVGGVSLRGPCRPPTSPPSRCVPSSLFLSLSLYIYIYVYIYIYIERERSLYIYIYIYIYRSICLSMVPSTSWWPQGIFGYLCDICCFPRSHIIEHIIHDKQITFLGITRVIVWLALKHGQGRSILYHIIQSRYMSNNMLGTYIYIYVLGYYHTMYTSYRFVMHIYIYIYTHCLLNIQILGYHCAPSSRATQRSSATGRGSPPTGLSL